MDWRQFENLYRSLLGLGRKRLMTLAAAGISVFALISLGTYFASRSNFETLYVGLTPGDVSRMGNALTEAGISFESSIDGTKLSVPVGQTAQARALLAEKGLPGSQTAGYELFDKLGALGLTSFMQEVTRVRALEGELSRTIQYLRGIRAARVHIFMPSQNALQVKKEAPSASVVIRTDVAGDATSAPAIKHLVASAIPEMSPDQVQVIGTDGSLLGGNGLAGGDAPVQMLDLERTVSKQIQDSVRRTLSPYLGFENFEVSALARLNIDKLETSETKFDPDSKVERSTRFVKEAQSSQDGSGKANVSVQENIPAEQTSNKDQTKRAQDRKEETTNYEISQKSASSKSEGYKIANISVAVVVNKKRLMDALGKDAKPEDVDKQVAEIEKIALSAAGIDKARGDRISVAAVEFAPSPFEEGSSASSGWAPLLVSLAGTGIQSLTILLVAAIVIMAGFRPVMRMLIPTDAIAIESAGGVSALETGIPALTGGGDAPLDMPEMASPLLEPGANPFDAFGGGGGGDFGSGLSFGRSLSLGPVEKLGAIIDRDEDQATAVMKHWVKNG
jgi:flagellar M-ring protein FliF